MLEAFKLQTPLQNNVGQPKISGNPRLPLPSVLKNSPVLKYKKEFKHFNLFEWIINKYLLMYLKKNKILS